MLVPFRLSLVGEQEDLIGEEIPEWGVLPCPGVPAVQNPHDVDALECDLLVNNIVAEEPGHNIRGIKRKSFHVERPHSTLLPKPTGGHS